MIKIKIFHHNDTDGRAAAAIVHLKLGGAASDFVEMDYKDRVPVEILEPDEKLIIVDFSLKPKDMEAVWKITRNIIWLDHHKTAFEYDYGDKEIEGERNNDYAGCELAWRYFFPSEDMPRAVKLVGDHDRWIFAYGEETRQFIPGMMLYEHGPTAAIWKQLLAWKKISPGVDSMHIRILKKICEKGKVCLQYRDAVCEDYCRSYGWETEFEGHLCFAQGVYMHGSFAFGDRIKKYDICLSYEFVGDNWIVGLYSECVDVSEIAKRYGGGGHRGAAGFVSEGLPFIPVKGTRE